MTNAERRLETVRQSEREMEKRGYSGEAWKARCRDLVIHASVYTAGISIARAKGRIQDEKILASRKLEITHELEKCYPLDCLIERERGRFG